MKKRLFSLFWALLLLLSACSNDEPSDTVETTQNSVASIEILTDAETDLTMPLTPLEPEFIKQDIVSRDEDGQLRYQAWSTIVKDENDTLYVVVSKRLQHVDPFGHNVLYKSTDGGETWTEGTVINDTPLDDRDAGLVYVGNGRMVMTYFCHPASMYIENSDKLYTKWQNNVTEAQKQAVLDRWAALSPQEKQGGSYVRISEDYGKTWGDPIRVPISSPHGPTLLSDGRLLYVGKTSYTSEYVSGIYAFVSEDGGKTWTLLSRIRFFKGYTDSEFTEPYAMELSNGRIMVALRGGGEKFPEGLTTFLTYSDDGGKSWVTPYIVRENFTGAPAHLLQCADGTLIMTYSRRANPCGIRVIISRDGGESWGEEYSLSNARDPADSDLGYPSTAQLADGTLLTVYYQHYRVDTYPSILYTKWKLVDSD